MGMVAERYSLFFTDHTPVRTFLPTINRVHNDEVRKLYPGALLPQFSFEEALDDTLCIVYKGLRSLSDLAQSFIKGTALLFKEQITVEHPHCQLRGDHQCRFDTRFLAPIPATPQFSKD
jgi:hypothetical protein